MRGTNGGRFVGVFSGFREPKQIFSFSFEQSLNLKALSGKV